MRTSSAAGFKTTQTDQYALSLTQRFTFIFGNVASPKVLAAETISEAEQYTAAIVPANSQILLYILCLK